MAQGSVGIGNVAGISIELHWTFLLLLLFSFLVGDLFFIVILLLFVCVLIHELAHSITALRNKISVRKIVLLPIGGASIIDETKMAPRTELDIALAGPVMSFVLAFAFGAISTITPIGTLTFIAQSLFELNLFMALFNILPAFPMDGGRVFRSYLERKRDFLSATMLTVKISKYFMGLIIIGTLIFVAFANSYSIGYREFLAFWNFIIVVFLYGGAQGEEQAAILREKTKGLYLSNAKSKNYLLIKPNTSLLSLYQSLKKTKLHIVLTKEGNTYLQVNLLSRPKAQNALARDLGIPIPSMPSSTNIFEALSRMQSMEIGIVAIVDKGKLLGIASQEALQSLITLHISSKK